MKILHILGNRHLPRDPKTESVSGVVRAALEIASAQRQLGHDVWVATVGRTGWTATWQGVRLVSLRVAAIPALRIAGRVLDFKLHLPYVLLTARQGFDIIHTHLYNYTRWLRADARVVHLHGDPLTTVYVGNSPALAPADFRMINRHSDAQIAVGQFISRQLSKGLQGAGATGNIHVVNNGVAGARFQATELKAERTRLRRLWGASDDDVVFAYVGAVVPEKGVITLARAFCGLSRHESKVHLALAGSSGLWRSNFPGHNAHEAYEARVHEVLDTEHLRSRTHLLGSVASSEVPAVYAASDIVVVPSIMQEPFSLVALEALASGKPVIASEVGGLPEVVNESSGILVPADNEEALREAMASLASDPGLRKGLAEGALAAAQGYTWHRAAAELDAIYTQCLRPKRPALESTTIAAEPRGTED